VNHEYFVTGNERHLHDREQEQHHQREDERQLDRRLTAAVRSPEAHRSA
jgi:hypothetical protein